MKADWFRTYLSWDKRTKDPYKIADKLRKERHQVSLHCVSSKPATPDYRIMLSKYHITIDGDTIEVACYEGAKRDIRVLRDVE